MSLFLLLVRCAHALPQLALPPEEDPAAWADAAALAGFGAGTPAEGTLTLEAGAGTWRVVARRAGVTRTVAVAPPRTAEAREDVLLLGRSLLRALDVPEARWRVTGWGAPAVVFPRPLGVVGAGGRVGLVADRAGLGLGADLRLVAPRALRAGGVERWTTADLGARVGGVFGDTTQLHVDGRLGLSARVYTEPGAAGQLDWKPILGGELGLTHALGGGWSVVGAVGLTVDLGPTRIETVDLAWTLGPWEPAASVGIGRQVW